jgi:RNA-binding protein
VENSKKRLLRRIAHHLSPVVTVGDPGLSDPVIAETQRALADHELIKVKLQVESRDLRRELGSTLARACNAEPVLSIGKVLVLYREAEEPNPDLSNVLRFNSP